MNLPLGRNRPHPALAEAMPRWDAFRGTSPISIPDGWDWGALCASALRTMLGNDALGDCTCAAVCHGIDVFSAGGAAPVTITTDQCVGLYSLSCGYVQGNPATDQGGNELSVISYVAAHGIDGNGLHQFAGAATLDATNLAECRESLWLTGANMYCLELPDAYAAATPGPDTVWDVAGAPNPSRGHCIVATQFTTNCPNGKPAWGCVTWGGIVWYTIDACAFYSSESNGGSANAALSHEWVASASQKAPNAIDWNGIVSAFQNDVGGVVLA